MKEEMVRPGVAETPRSGRPQEAPPEMALSLWLVMRNDSVGYDEYEGDVIAAETEVQAREMSYVGGYPDITVTRIGDAAKGIPPGHVLSSFNAG